MKIYKPEIAELLLLVEKEHGHALHTTNDFDTFSACLKQQFGEVISTSTLKRLWGYVNDLHAPRLKTLDLLSRYLGHADFQSFSDWLKSTPLYNSSFYTTKQLLAKELHAGALVEIGWSPNRYLLLCYKGDTRFEVVEARHSKLLVGDCFETAAFLKGQPLLLPYVQRGDVRTSSFLAGRNGGLTLINMLSNGE